VENKDPNSKTRRQKPDEAVTGALAEKAEAVPAATDDPVRGPFIHDGACVFDADRKQVAFVSLQASALPVRTNIAKRIADALNAAE